MTRFRNRLLILLALLAVGLFSVRGVANAAIQIDWDSFGSDPVVSPYTGEPDVPSVKKTSASIAPGNESASTISNALRFYWASRIWAAVQLGLDR